jgi:hypothetical protein
MSLPEGVRRLHHTARSGTNASKSGTNASARHQYGTESPQECAFRAEARSPPGPPPHAPERCGSATDSSSTS